MAYTIDSGSEEKFASTEKDDEIEDKVDAETIRVA